MILVIFRNVRHVHISGIQCSHLHCHILHSLFDCIRSRTGFRLDQHADSPAAVYIRDYNPIVRCQLFKTTDGQLLTDHCGDRNQCFLHGFIFVFYPRFRKKSIHIFCIRQNCLLGNCFYKILEFLVLRHKIRFRIHLYYCSGFVILYRHSGETFRRNPASLLLCLHCAIFSQIFYCRIHIAVGLAQRLLAFHHTGASRLTQFFHHCCCNRHFRFLSGKIPSFSILLF